MPPLYAFLFIINNRIINNRSSKRKYLKNSVCRAVDVNLIKDK
jgi:hypothetical protein